LNRRSSNNNQRKDDPPPRNLASIAQYALPARVWDAFYPAPLTDGHRKHTRVWYPEYTEMRLMFALSG
jgi:hypothetical protein